MQDPMIENPLVSVIVPVYNTEDYLCELIDCITKQTYENLQIICVDDGSKDNSLAILKEAALQDSRIEIIAQPNKGEGAARNAGMAIANGSLIICFDSDDLCELDMIELMVQPFIADPEVDIVICAIDKYHEDIDVFKSASWAVDENVPSFEVFYPHEINQIFEHVCGYATNKMVKKKLIDQYSLSWQEGLRIHGDMSFVQAALALSRKAYFVDKPLYHHRLRSSGTSSSNTNQDLYECMLLALEQIMNKLKESGAYPEFERTYVNYALQQIRWKHGMVNPRLHKEMEAALRETWFEKLDISSHPANSFANQDDYQFMKSILEPEETQSQPAKKKTTKKKCASIRARLGKIKRSFSK